MLDFAFSATHNCVCLNMKPPQKRRLSPVCTPKYLVYVRFFYARAPSDFRDMSTFAQENTSFVKFFFLRADLKKRILAVRRCAPPSSETR